MSFPKLRLRPDGAERTLADDEQEGLRPYWVHVRPENLIFAHAEIIDGKEVLTHIRIAEIVSEMVGFTEVFKERIRVYDRVLFFEQPERSLMILFQPSQK